MRFVDYETKKLKALCEAECRAEFSALAAIVIVAAAVLKAANHSEMIVFGMHRMACLPMVVLLAGADVVETVLMHWHCRRTFRSMRKARPHWRKANRERNKQDQQVAEQLHVSQPVAVRGTCVPQIAANSNVTPFQRLSHQKRVSKTIAVMSASDPERKFRLSEAMPPSSGSTR